MSGMVRIHLLLKSCRQKRWLIELPSVYLPYNTDPATRHVIIDRFVAMNTLIALLMVHDQARFD
jgi:hypothetical protein